ncbi:protein dispatched homolog 2 [Eucyclogobius newberryi]|uniref:protein dispatched homolog 2 n=1 Tax=Eucyclogobius newberryi TaxID=166745 RepID=UPI003B5B64CB
MNASSLGESSVVMDDFPLGERTRAAAQSDPPSIALCPPEHQCTVDHSEEGLLSEGGLCDSCSSLGRPYHHHIWGQSLNTWLCPSKCDTNEGSACLQVQQISHLGPFDSSLPRTCPDSSQVGTCQSCPRSSWGKHECSPNAIKMRGGQGLSSAQSSCPGPVRCHWLHSSDDSGPHTLTHARPVRDEGLSRIIRIYGQLLVEHPLALLLGCALLLLGFSGAALLIGPLPDFSNPLMGFEPRGTYISLRESSLQQLLENTGPGRTLSLLPQALQRVGGADRLNSSKARTRRMLARHSTPDSFLCDAPGEHLAQLVFRSENAASLWSLKTIQSMCEMEQSRIRSQAHFQDVCQQPLRSDPQDASSGCCPSWSLGNYLAVLTNASCCLSLTAHQVSESLNLLRKCAPYYHEGHLSETCVDRPKHGGCALVPSRCKQSHVVFQILHFLVDKDFLGPQTIKYQIPTLKYSLLFLPLEKGEDMMGIYMNSLEGRNLSYNNTTITGMDFGIKQSLFRFYLSRDCVYPVLAVMSLLFSMTVYLQSPFVVMLSVLAIAGSLLTSYFLYKVVYRLIFFPLVNFTAAIFLLGICSNQVFIFADFWNLLLSQRPCFSLEKRVNRILHEVCYLIIATGLTSSAAFFAGFLSSLPAIRCFAIYLGTASFVSSLLALVWLPCSFILRERYMNSSPVAVQGWRPCCSKNTNGFWETSSRKKCLFNLSQKMREIKRGLSDTSNLLFMKILPCGVVKFRYIWVCWFAVLAAGGIYMACVEPGMKLPTLESKVTQLFRSSHPFERYDAEYRHMFMFKRQRNGEDMPLSLQLVWGVKATDNGDHFNPHANNSLVLDPEFNMSSPDSQVWLKDLCAHVQNQSFYLPPSPEDKSMVENVCLVEQLVEWTSMRHCAKSNDPADLCCANQTFPFHPAVFERCLSLLLADRYSQGRLAHAGGVYFHTDGRIAALVLAFRTTYLKSFNYNTTNVYYRQILAWFTREKSGSPPGLARGWFVSQLTLLDLQQSLGSEMLLVSGFSIALTFVFLLVSTWNIPLSLYGMVAVGGSVFVTIGLLVLLEWQLSGIEALFISCAAGLAVDFIANYSIAYSLAPHSDKIGKVAHATKRMGCPVAVVSGAFFCMGIIMLPSTALLFRKLGIFLFLVKCVACGFATFFFQSLCCFFGPQQNCGRTTFPCFMEQTESCVTLNNSASSAVNGAFDKNRVRRSNDQDGGGYLYPNHQRQQKQKPTVGTGQGYEQYELQPLAYRLSDSFENSTCTSKLSNRPSVLSDEIQFCSREDMSTHQNKMCPTPPALQTSSPYKETSVQHDFLHQDKQLCTACRGHCSGLKHWSNTAFSSSSSIEETMASHTLETIDHLSLCKDEAKAQNKPLWGLSQGSYEGLEDSNDTGLSITEAKASTFLQSMEEEQHQPGHLNEKRDTLRLSLKETPYECENRGRSSEVVILPNSKPDLPDVWIKRRGEQDDSC